MRKPSKTLEQKNGHNGMVKAGELIEIKQAHVLTLQDGRVFDRLLEYAWPEISKKDEFRCPIWMVRGPRHKGAERVRDSVARLMNTMLSVPFLDPDDGKRKVLQTALIAGTVSTEDEDDPDGEIIYSFSPQLRRVLQNSNYWGRIKSVISYAMSSKYAYRLYQAVALRVNRGTNVQEFTVESFRELLAVAPGKYPNYPQFNQWVVGPAVQEVNGLSDFVVEIEPRRAGGMVRGKLLGYTVTWRKKTPEEWELASRELLGSKIGRKERIKGNAEQLSAMEPLDLFAAPVH